MVDYVDDIQNINGPLNVVRLEGDIGGVKKVIYLFFEVHIPVIGQTECDDVDSIDIHQYIRKTLKEAKHKFPDTTYDFVLEIQPSTVYIYREDIVKTAYIHQLRKLFSKLVSKNKEQNKEQNKKPNVRYHYIDIRDHWISSGISLIDNAYHYFQSEIYNYPHDIMIRTITALIDMLLNYHKFIVAIYEMLYGKGGTEKKDLKSPVVYSYEEMKKYTTEDLFKISEKLVKKIFGPYNHKIVQKQILDELNTEIKDWFHKIDSGIKKLGDYLEKKSEPIKNHSLRTINTKDLKSFTFRIPLLDSHEIIHSVAKQMNIIYNTSEHVFFKLVDLYLLRRILDKDYIHNIIIYTGALHSINYVFFLVNKLNFKITHASYTSEQSIDSLNKKIKSKKDFIEITPLLIPQKLYQCSDMSNFPKYFQ
jgi:hypothetical protein